MSNKQDLTQVTVAAKTGKVVAKKKGTCFIYAYACDGKMARCKIKVK